IEVVVTEGKVAVKRGTQALVSAGNRILLDASGNRGPEPSDVQPISDDALRQRLAWRSPTIDFSDAPFSEVVNLINRHNPQRFVIDDPSLDAVRVSGHFRPADTAAVIRLLETAFGVNADVQPDGT